MYHILKSDCCIIPFIWQSRKINLWKNKQMGSHQTYKLIQRTGNQKQKYIYKFSPPKVVTIKISLHFFGARSLHSRDLKWELLLFCVWWGTAHSSGCTAYMYMYVNMNSGFCFPTWKIMYCLRNYLVNVNRTALKNQI